MKRLLIANRGEIVLRVIRAARKLGIETVSVFSEADRRHPHVGAADFHASLGSGSVSETYLNIGTLLSVAEDFSVDAVHPGYGFLAESAEFAERVTKAGLCFVGPSAEAMRLLGDKQKARALAEKAKVPVLPGYHGEEQSVEAFSREASLLGFPLMLKAAAGGGGKGMRLLTADTPLEDALRSAKREALGFFGNDTLILESLLEPARHIEVQILADHHQNVLHLFERECSLQRRHQKIIEESPAPGISPKLRAALTEAAVRIAEAASLTNASTVEFLVDAKDPERFYFLEVNTRVQVEHPVTEAITGIDIVVEQLRIADGEPIALAQSDIQMRGAAMEARIYAESPGQGFLPKTGRIEYLDFGPSVQNLRFDHALQAGIEITADYDPLLAKCIVRGGDRLSVIQSLGAALEHFTLLGVEHNASYLTELLEHLETLSTPPHTRYLDQEQEKLLGGIDETRELEVVLAALEIGKRSFDSAASESVCFTAALNWRPGFWRAGEGRSLFAPQRAYLARSAASGKTLQSSVEVLEYSEERAVLLINQTRREIHYRLYRHGALCQLEMQIEGEQFLTTLLFGELCSATVDGHLFFLQQLGSGAKEGAAEGAASKQLCSPLPGKILDVRVQAGAEVQVGDVLLVIESMKMEHNLTATHPSKVNALLVGKEDTVQEGQLLLEFA